VNIQDLRDVEGDRVVGRKTLPIVYGDIVARRIIAGSTALAVGILWWGGILAIAPVSLVLVHAFLAYRVVRAVSGPRYDHKTYMVGFLSYAISIRR
jgi:4-hydroxybenzoate polyprenyltransferase